MTYIPAGVGYFTAKGNSPSFGNYGLGTAGSYHVNRFIGIEGESVAMISTTSSLQCGDVSFNIKAPNVLAYTGNVLYSPWTGHSVAPYAAGGIGGLTMFERPLVGVNNGQTFLVGNVGGGVKWYARNGRWACAATIVSWRTARKTTLRPSSAMTRAMCIASTVGSSSIRFANQ